MSAITVEKPHGPHGQCARCAPPKAPAAPFATEGLAAALPPPSEGPPDEAPIELTPGQKRELEMWLTNSSVNPQTNMKISAGGDVHRRLTREYQALQDRADPEKTAQRNAARRELARAEKEAAAKKHDTYLAAACARVSAANRNRDAWRARMTLTRESEFILCSQCNDHVRYVQNGTECPDCEIVWREGVPAPSLALVEEPGRRQHVSVCSCMSSHRLSCANCGWSMEKKYQRLGVTKDEFLNFIRADMLRNTAQKKA